MHSEHNNRCKYSYIYTVYITCTYTFLYAALQDSLVGFFVVLLQVHMAKFIYSGNIYVNIKYVCIFFLCANTSVQYKCGVSLHFICLD